MIVTNQGVVEEKVITLRELSLGDLFRFPYEQRIRELSQKGRIEGYCPIIGDYGSTISGDEVYHLSAKVIKIEKQSNECSDKTK